MIEKKFELIEIDQGSSLNEMCKILLNTINSSRLTIKITIFGSSTNNEQYIADLKIIRERITNYYSKEIVPLISYVSQKPLLSKLAAEVVTIPRDPNIEIVRGDQYLILKRKGITELLTEGIQGKDLYQSIEKQSKEVFKRIESILYQTDFKLCQVCRQWNYIEKITSEKNGLQNYQVFNDSRSAFYQLSEWTNGYPAATGIGMENGGIMVEIMAIKGESILNKAIDNPLQVSAYRYSQEVLIGPQNGKSTPKFERAKAVGTDINQYIYISGTAAIQGERSVDKMDVLEQAKSTINNIDYLISTINYPRKMEKTLFEILRIYLKKNQNPLLIKTYLDEHFPSTPKIYLSADICRSELLIEIEGVVFIK